jgi:hypothetical protein
METISMIKHSSADDHKSRPQPQAIVDMDHDARIDPNEERLVQGTLKAFFEPASVAVIGASTHPKKLGYAVLKNLKKLWISPEGDNLSHPSQSGGDPGISSLSFRARYRQCN